nr:chaperone protein dnaj [Quercus suber]
MAPAPATEDYYMVLELSQTATSEQIKKAYRRLAPLVHPDRNANKEESTKNFQLLGQAYETLSDEDQRREYDRIYPTISRNRPNHQHPQPPRPSPSSAPQADVYGEAAEIAAIEKRKKESAARWDTRRRAIEPWIFELQRVIRRLEKEIEGLASVAAAEAAEQAQKNSWGRWLLSPFYKPVEESEDEKLRKDRHRQERKIDKINKERRLATEQTKLQRESGFLEEARQENEEVAGRSDREKQVVLNRARVRETRERLERERVDRERLDKIRRDMLERERVEQERLNNILREQLAQRERIAQEEREARREQEAEARAAESLRQQANRRRQRDNIRFGSYSPDVYPSVCEHDGWWDKVHGRRACPDCGEVWTYLLQCPGCDILACPKCQKELRPKYRGRTPWTNQRQYAQPRSLSPDPFDYCRLQPAMPCPYSVLISARLSDMRSATFSCVQLLAIQQSAIERGTAKDQREEPLVAAGWKGIVLETMRAGEVCTMAEYITGAAEVSIDDAASYQMLYRNSKVQ